VSSHRPRTRRRSALGPRRPASGRPAVPSIQSDAAKLCDVAVETIRRIEIDDATVKEATIEKVRAAFEKAGMEFIAENGGGPSVRLRKAKGKRK
jgi:hypothetical protein